MAKQINPFGTRRDGGQVHAITLADGALTATLLTHGAVLQSLHLAGVPHSLILGSPELAAYEGDMAYFGAMIAPVANRISGARAQVGGQAMRLAANEGANTLHSGPTGAHSALWTLADHGPAHATLTLALADRLGGFPGNRQVTATYRLGGDTLSLALSATTDAPTLMNLAHHGYWNMDGTLTWAGHTLHIHADHILPTDADRLPTGTVQPLTGHPHDFRAPRTIAPGDVPPMDHNFCLAPARRALAPAVRLTGRNGVTMQIDTTEPGLQVFDGGPINTGTLPTLHGRPYTAHCGFALEPQAWPDAPHNQQFPDITLAPGDTYSQTTTFRFTRT